MIPISVDLPHTLGKAEARRRIEGGIGGLTRHLPAGAQVQPQWSGDQLNLAIAAMGQDMRARLDVQEALVRLEVVLPPALGFLAGMIEAGIRRGGAELLEDKSGKR